jgi:UDP-N-acetylmuramoylalanine--D-glutamate ligase
MTNWNNTHTLILGAARQGIALARWLSRHGSHVILSDLRSMEQLASACDLLADTNVEWAAGGHPIELLDGVDVLCLSGGVPLTLPIVQEAVKRGILLSNDTQIFLEVAPCKTIGITGSAGKTTTTTLVGEMAKQHFKMHTMQNAFIGGNIGDPLINYVDQMNADDLAIIEISSFQLEQMTISPNISAILNITPNHLDRHGTMEAYTDAKARILEFQTEKDTAILGHDDKGAWNLRNQVKGKLLTFSLKDLPEHLDGAYFHGGLLSLREGKAYVPLMAREKIKLPGDHNVANVLAAFTIGHVAGFKLDNMLEVVEEFRGVHHRLELVRELRGVRWYNGSIATAPERSMADIHAFDEPIVLMLGGRDKDLPWDGIAKLIHKRVDHVVVFGEAAELIQKAISVAGGTRSGDLRCAKNLKEAVAIATEVARAGDIVLFSPGGTSYDEFKDFEERGDTFKKWVLELS